MPVSAASPRPIRVVLADDHALVRRGLASLLGMSGRFEVIGEAGDGEEVLELLAREQVDLLLLDLSMPRLNGLETLRRLRATGWKRPVLMLSMYGDEQFAAQALAAGARGYLLKHAMDDELFRAIDAVLAGREYVSEAMSEARLVASRADTDVGLGEKLTEREQEVLRLILAGKSTTALAEVLGISPHTAVRHRANLMRKLGAHNRVELLRRSAELALTLPTP
jgi:DNA-binding NarL/FixJ family response regulator